MSDELDTDDVYDLLNSISERDINGIRLPTGQAFWLRFDADDPREENPGLGTDSWRFEVNFYDGNLWLHKETDDGTETVWKNKRSRY